MNDREASSDTFSTSHQTLFKNLLVYQQTHTHTLQRAQQVINDKHL